jgi:hypothetical protein
MSIICFEKAKVKLNQFFGPPLKSTDAIVLETAAQARRLARSDNIMAFNAGKIAPRWGSREPLTSIHKNG